MTQAREPLAYLCLLNFTQEQVVGQPFSVLP